MADLNHNLTHCVNVDDPLTRGAARYPDRIALVEGERRGPQARTDQ